jgi:hypothetical protein
MTPNETSTLSSDTLLMIRSFRQANPDKRDGQLSAAEFLQKNAHRIRGIGPLLELAGLAEQDAQSDLGWRPTPHLITLIANRGGGEAATSLTVVQSTEPTLIMKADKPYQCPPQVGGMPVLPCSTWTQSPVTRDWS